MQSQKVARTQAWAGRLTRRQACAEAAGFAAVSVPCELLLTDVYPLIFTILPQNQVASGVCLVGKHPAMVLLVITYTNGDGTSG